MVSWLSILSVQAFGFGGSDFHIEPVVTRWQISFHNLQNVILSTYFE